MASTSSFSKQVVIFLLVLSFLNPVYASNALGGWSMSNPVAQGASTLYNASKNVMINGKNVVKTSTALITPTATSVAKLLGKGVAGVALSVAVEQLLGAVDWVLDPANNQIKYVIPNNDGTDPNKLYGSAQIGWFNTLTEAGRAHVSHNDSTDTNFQWTFKYVQVVSGSPRVYIQRCYRTNLTNCLSIEYNNIGSKVITQPKEEEQKTLPLTTVAAQVISNAESNTDKRAAAQAATTAAAADMVKDAESDNVKARPIVDQLESNSKVDSVPDSDTATGSQTQNPTKPDTTDLKIQFPAFCGWAPIVCEAAQVAIAFPRLVTGWWETIVEKTNSWATSISQSWAAVKEEYADKPKENTDTKLDIPDVPTSAPDTTLNFGGSCPAPLSAPYSFFGLSGAIEFSFDPVCQIASFIKPVVISVAAFSSVLIVAGIRTEDD